MNKEILIFRWYRILTILEQIVRITIVVLRNQTTRYPSFVVQFETNFAKYIGS